MLEEYKKVSDKVEYILKTYPESRNSDKWLIYFYSVTFIGKCSDIRDWIFSMPNFESLRRNRQKIQETGRYQSSKQIRKAREVE